MSINQSFRELYNNSDDSMVVSAEATLKHNSTLPTNQFIIPEKTPTDLRGKGRKPAQDGIKQFPGDRKNEDVPAHR
jgi:acyl-CoA dehydrogenase family member 9